MGEIYSGWLGALTIRIKPTLDAMTKTDSLDAEARARASHRGAEVSADWNTATTDALLAAATLDPIIAPQSLYSAAYNSTGLMLPLYGCAIEDRHVREKS